MRLLELTGKTGGRDLCGRSPCGDRVPLARGRQARHRGVAQTRGQRGRRALWALTGSGDPRSQAVPQTIAHADVSELRTDPFLCAGQHGHSPPVIRPEGSCQPLDSLARRPCRLGVAGRVLSASIATVRATSVGGPSAANDQVSVRALAVAGRRSESLRRCTGAPSVIRLPSAIRLRHLSG